MFHQVYESLNDILQLYEEFVGDEVKEREEAYVLIL